MFTINIDENRKCNRCGKGGATESGLCLKCISRAIKRGDFDHILEQGKKGFIEKMTETTK
jgi:hypothetical protein